MRLVFAILSFLLVSCTALPLESTATPTPGVPGVEFMEYPLSQPPEPESTLLHFADPSGGDPRLLHPALRAEPWIFEDWYCGVMNENPMAMCARLGDSELVAWEEYENSGYGQVVLTKDGEEIYSIDIGHGSPIPALQRLWAWEGHWALETVHVTIREQGNVIYSQGRGQVTIDGVLLTESLGCEEVFGFQLIHDQPFYFVSRGGLQDARYAGLQVPLAYDEIPHYNCCGNATLNPQMFKDMVAFFARRGSTWHYAEIGLFALP